MIENTFNTGSYFIGVTVGLICGFIIGTAYGIIRGRKEKGKELTKGGEDD